MLIKQTNKKTMMSQNRFMGERKSAGKKVNKIKLSLIKNYTSRNEGSSATLKQTNKQKNLHSCKADSRWDLKKKQKHRRIRTWCKVRKNHVGHKRGVTPLEDPWGRRKGCQEDTEAVILSLGRPSACVMWARLPVWNVLLRRSVSNAKFWKHNLTAYVFKP